MCTHTQKTSIDIEDLLKFEPRAIDLITEHYDSIKQIIFRLLADDSSNESNLQLFIKKQCAEHKIHGILQKSSLLYVYRKMYVDKDIATYDPKIEEKLKGKASRSASGVEVCALTMSPYPNSNLIEDKELYQRIRDETVLPEESAAANTCDYECYFCESSPGMPKSYDRFEPSVAAGLQNYFDPQRELRSRLATYIINGHALGKIEIILLGGTITSFERFTKKVTIDDHGIVKEVELKYLEWFLCSVYYEANTLFELTNKRMMKTIKEEMKINETSINTIIGVTIETRPDCVSSRAFKWYRELGITRIQIGVQSLDDNILLRINRGCTTKDYIKALRLAKQFGYKIDTHQMPDLPKPYTTEFLNKTNGKAAEDFEIEDIDWNHDMVIKDLETFYGFIFDAAIKSDQWKIYPCSVISNTPLLKQFQKGLHKPYANEYYTKDELEAKYNYSQESFGCGPRVDWNNRHNINISLEQFKNDFRSFINFFVNNYESSLYNLLDILIIYVKIHVPVWVRLNRITRDIPTHFVKDGVKHTVIHGGVCDPGKRTIIEKIMNTLKLKCNCIRCREIGNDKYDRNNVNISVVTYDASEGIEHFIQCVTDDNKLLGFLRLRFDNMAGRTLSGQIIFPELIDAAMIRELHVYGTKTGLYEKRSEQVQHTGIGYMLVTKAIEMAESAGYKKITVISGEGVKQYYRNKFGFADDGLYLSRPIFSNKLVPKDNGIIMLYIFMLILICWISYKSFQNMI